MSKRQAVKSISLLWMGAVLGAGCAFLTQVILARKLGPVDFGIFSAALATVTMLAPVAGFGVSQYWLKAFGQEGWGAMRWLPTSFRFVFFSTVLVLIVLLVWARFGPHDPATRNVIAALSLYVLGQVVIELVGAKLQLEQQYSFLAVWQLLPHLVRFTMVLLLAFALTSWMNILNVALAYSIVSIIFLIFGGKQLLLMFRTNFDLKGHGSEKPTTQSKKPELMEFVSQSWPFGLAGFFYLIYFQSDIILLKYLAGSEAAGIYNVAFVVMVAVYILPTVIYQKFLLPKIHRWANHDRAKFLQVYRAGNGIMLVMGGFATIVLLLVMPILVPRVFGPSYQTAASVLTILSFCAPMRFLATSVGSTLVTQEHMRRKILYMGVVAVVNLILNFILIPFFGIYGAAIATLISEVVLLSLYLLAAKSYVFGDEAWRGWTLNFRNDNV